MLIILTPAALSLADGDVVINEPQAAPMPIAGRARQRQWSCALGRLMMREEDRPPSSPVSFDPEEIQHEEHTDNIGSSYSGRDHGVRKPKPGSEALETVVGQ
ncbi:MAG: hypothetical protein M3Y05_02395 [Gemmatimonadota bacterium]|nr:hypothetical protein [Gemmatimonadota bacterium]